MRHATLCFLIRGYPPQEVLLGYKKVGFGATKYNGIGGKVEVGESVVSAAARELQEETGVKVAQDDLQQVGHLTFTFRNESDWDQIVHVYLTKTWDGEPEESSEMAPTWFSVDDIPFERMWADDQYWLPRILAGERIRGHFTFGADSETIDEFEVTTWDRHR